MHLYLDTIPLHLIGDFTVSQSREYEGGDHPQRCRVTLRVTVQVFEDTFAQNMGRLLELQQAIRRQHAQLLWMDPATGQEFFNQPVVIAGHDVPEEWGTYHQQLQLTFLAYEHNLQPGNLQLRVRKLPPRHVGADPVEDVYLDHCIRFQDSITTERYSPLHDARRLARRRIEASGLILGDVTLPLDQRRPQLQARADQLRRALDGARGWLEYGPPGQEIFKRIVRVEEVRIELDQIAHALNWSLVATATQFPVNEDSYGLIEFQVDERDAMNGEKVLTFGGQLQAPTEAEARQRLDLLTEEILTAYGYVTTEKDRVQPLRRDISLAQVRADTDGPAFLALNFQLEYRRWTAPENPVVTYAPEGGAPLSLGALRQWQVIWRARRPHELRAQRTLALVQIEAAGTLAAVPGMPLAQRHQDLLARQAALVQAVNQHRQGVLRYGTLPPETVRITDFQAEVNQAKHGIDWRLSAEYVRFPANLDTYTLTELTAEIRDSQTGERFLALSGRVGAATEAQAAARLAQLVNATRITHGFGERTQNVRYDTTAQHLEADADGATFIELAFQVEDRQFVADNLRAHLVPETGQPVSLGEVRTWNLQYQARRFNELRAQRQRAAGTVEASGIWVPPLPAAPTTRAAQPAAGRAELLAAQLAAYQACNRAEIRLRYGDWEQLVRIQDFRAAINQARNGIEWTLVADWTVFPDETDMATAEFTVEIRTHEEDYDQSLIFQGRILAPDRPGAMNKMVALRTAVLNSHGWAASHQLRSQVSFSLIDANGERTEGITSTDSLSDGGGFLELAFTEEYRRRRPGALLRWNLQVNQRQDIPAGLQYTTYSGVVEATGVTVTDAYQAARAKAAELGANKHTLTTEVGANAWLRQAQWSWERRKLNNGAEEFLTLTFSYEYQGKLGADQIAYEVSAQTQRETFGEDTIQVTGNIAAPTRAQADPILDWIRGLYSGRILLNEQVVEQRQYVRRASSLGNDPVQMVRLEYSFSVREPKTGAWTARYGLTTVRDFLTLEQTTTLSGSIWAETRIAAENAIATLRTAHGLGQPVWTSVREEREYTSAVQVMVKVDFEERHVNRITGITAALEARLNQSVRYSATRWVVQPLPFNADGSGGVSIPQPCGWTEGERTVRGSVTAANEAICNTWAAQHRSRLTGSNGQFFEHPEQWEWEYEYVPGDTSTIRLVRLNFTFGEIIPFLPPPGYTGALPASSRPIQAATAPLTAQAQGYYCADNGRYYALNVVLDPDTRIPMLSLVELM